MMTRMETHDDRKGKDKDKDWKDNDGEEIIVPRESQPQTVQR